MPATRKRNAQGQFVGRKNRRLSTVPDGNGSNGQSNGHSKGNGRRPGHTIAQGEFTLAKSTKGAFQYREDGPPESHVMRTAYVRKDSVNGDGAPRRLLITITELA